MTCRLISGALALLVLTSPLGAALCASCLPGDCATEAMAIESPQQVDSASADHCHEASAGHTTEPTTEAASETPAGSSVPSSISCCKVYSASKSEAAALPPTVPTAEPIHAIISSIAPDAAASSTLDDRRGSPLRPAPPPLYTLHSSLLI